MKLKSPFRAVLLSVLLFSGACGFPTRAAPPSPTPDPEPESVVVPEFPYSLAWTARSDVPIHTEAGEQRIPHPFTRLNVLAVDTLGLHVHCLYCIPTLQGVLSRDDVVYEALTPDSAARLGLAELVLAVREAASRRDQEALSRVMPRDFTFSFEGGVGPIDAFHRWRFQGYRALDNLPPLLDRGLATRDGVIWSAPPAFVTDPDYHGLRAGFRRAPDGRWEWIFLVGWD